MGKMMLLILRVGSVVTIIEDDSREKIVCDETKFILGLKGLVRFVQKALQMRLRDPMRHLQTI